MQSSDQAASSPPLQQQVELLKQQLAQAQRLSALGELVGTTTHEFNNVLMTIINYAKMGLRHKDDATREKAFSKILAAGERAAKITNSVLGMARNRSDASRTRRPSDTRCERGPAQPLRYEYLQGQEPGVHRGLFCSYKLLR